MLSPHASLRRADSDASASAREHAWGDVAQRVFDRDIRLLLDGNEVLHGTDAINALRRESRATWSAEWTPLRASASLDATRGYSVGTIEWRPSGNAPERAYGKYLAWWRRERTGEWRIAAYVQNARDAADESWRGVVADDTAALDRDRTRPDSESLSEFPLHAVLAADRAFAADGRHNLADAFERWAAPRAILLGSTPDFACGPQSIKRAFDGMPPTMSLMWEPTFADVAASGDLAVTIGRGVLRDASTAPVRDIERRYLCVWQRTIDGAWRYVADGGVAGPAPR